MRLIDADKLKAHYAWWGDEYSTDDSKKQKELFDTIVDLQPTLSAAPGGGHWIAPKVWHEDYVDKHINGWERGLDNGIEMLECPKCKCRVFADHYIFAVGAQGFNFCPYCGEDLRPDQMTMEELL